MILCRRELNIGIGEQDVRRDNVEVGNGGTMYSQGLSLKDCRKNSVFFGELLIIVQKHFTAICLAIHIDKEDTFAFVG